MSNVDQVDGYEHFLEVILSGHHPNHCHIIWTGDVCQIVFTKKFRGNENEPLDRVRRKAWQWLRSIKADERRLMEITVQTKNGVPEYAVVKVRPEAFGVLRLGTARLQELVDPARNS